MSAPQPGSKAPAFTLKDQDGETVKLSDFKGKTLVLYFYPRADTPGCTTQACGIRDRFKEYAKAGAVIVAVSPDEPEALSLDRAHALLSSDKRLTGVSREGEQLNVNLADAEDGRPASHHFVLKLLIDSGARIAAFEPRAAKLEDAFLRLTKGVVN